MAFNWEEAKKEAKLGNNQPQREPEQPNKPSEIAELKVLINNLLESEERQLNANFEYLINDISRQLKEEIVKEVAPMVDNLKSEIQNVEINANDMKNKIKGMFYFSGIKEFIFWLSCVCNIGFVIYIIYKFVDWSALIQ